MLHFIPRCWNATWSKQTQGEHLPGASEFSSKFCQKIYNKRALLTCPFIFCSQNLTPLLASCGLVSFYESLKSWLLLVLIHFAQSANFNKAWLNFEGRWQQSRDERERAEYRYLFHSAPESNYCILKRHNPSVSSCLSPPGAYWNLLSPVLYFKGEQQWIVRVFVYFLTQK